MRRVQKGQNTNRVSPRHVENAKSSRAQALQSLLPMSDLRTGNQTYFTRLYTRLKDLQHLSSDFDMRRVQESKAQDRVSRSRVEQPKDTKASQVPSMLHLPQMPSR